MRLTGGLGRGEEAAVAAGREEARRLGEGVRDLLHVLREEAAGIDALLFGEGDLHRAAQQHERRELGDEPQRVEQVVALHAGGKGR